MANSEGGSKALIDGVGVAIPQDVVEGQFDDTALRSYVEAAERAGFASLWVLDNHGRAVLSPLELLAYTAAISTRARLGVGVLISALHSPLHLARELATIDRLSNGRLVIGLGLGGDREAYRRHGLTVQHRAAHFEAGAVLVQQLLADEVLTARPPWLALDGRARPLAPVQEPRPPIWFGAERGAALERSARLGEGWMAAGSSTLAEFEIALGQVEQRLAALGKPRSRFTIAKRVYVHVGSGSTDGTTGDALRKWFGRHYGNERLADRVVRGSATEVVDQLARFRSLGTDLLVLHPVLDMPDQLDALVADVLPRVPPPSRSVD